jgi:hypothetical protein
MADFLAANPRDVIVIGMSNINCGDKELTRQQLLQVGSLHQLSQLCISTLPESVAKSCTYALEQIGISMPKQYHSMLKWCSRVTL